MNDEKMSSPLDAALAHVGADRRRFLGMLLAGVVSVPLLASEDLAAEGSPNNLRTVTWTKGGSPQRSNRSAAMGRSGSRRSSSTGAGRSNAYAGRSSRGVNQNNRSLKLNNGSALKNSNSGALKNSSQFKDNIGTPSDIK